MELFSLEIMDNIEKIDRENLMVVAEAELCSLRMRGVGNREDIRECGLHACGDIKEMELKSGETIKADTSSVVAWEDSVNYSVNRVRGVKTVLFAGEGLLLTALTGSGKVWIQSMILHCTICPVRYLPTFRESPAEAVAC